MPHHLKRWALFFSLCLLFCLPLYVLSGLNGVTPYEYLLQWINPPSLLIAFSFALGIFLMVISEKLARKLFLVHGKSGRGSVKIINGEDVR